MAITGFRDTGNVLRDVSPETPLPVAGYRQEYPSRMAIATGLAANTIVNHTTPHDPANRQYNSIDLGLYVDLPKEVRARRVYAEWDMNASSNGDHWYQVVAGVWDNSASQFLTPLKPLLSARRNASIGGGHDAGSFSIFPNGNGNGQSVSAHAAAEITIVLPQDWYDLVASNPDAYIRFIMGLRNATSTDITAPWRAMFMVIGAL